MAARMCSCLFFLTSMSVIELEVGIRMNEREIEIFVDSYLIDRPARWSSGRAPWALL